MDLYADFAAACSKELQAAGYTPPGGTTADLIRAYANVKHRRVSVRPRKVHKASYSVPSPLAAGEQAFLAAVAAGDDLLPHQSTRLEDHAFDDGMLNDFGIHHFHLGTVPYARNPKFRDRRDPLLFAVVRPDDLYVIGYYKHQEWAKRDLLDVIHAMWPDLLAAAIPGIAPQPLGFNASDADIKNFRKAAINPITQRPDGTPHVSPGGGAALDGTSARVAAYATRTKSLCNRWEREIRARVIAMLTSGELMGPVKLSLQQRGQNAVVIVEGGTTEFKLGPVLIVPPL